MKTVDKPWGKEIWFAMTQHYMGKILIINPNQQVSLHVHMYKEETFYIEQGDMQLSNNGHSKIYKAGRRVHIKPRTKHSMQAFDEKVILFEVSTPHPEDSVRIKDYYGRPCEKC